MTEEERAELHRTQQAQRAAAEQARFAALAGNDAAVAAVKAAWKPRFDALLPQPPQPLPEELEPCPTPPRVPGWVELPERYRC